MILKNKSIWNSDNNRLATDVFAHPVVAYDVAVTCYINCSMSEGLSDQMNWLSAYAKTFFTFQQWHLVHLVKKKKD